MSAPWECLSCGAHAQTKPFCEQCGAAMPVEGDDSALSLMLGLVCESCDAYNDPGVSVCSSCGKPLAVDGEPAPPPPPAPSAHASIDPPSWLTPPTGQPLSTSFAMPKVDLAAVATGAEGAGVAAPRPPGAAPAPAPVPTTPAALPSLCTKCGTPLQPADKFCRNCGTRAGEAKPMSTMQISVAKLPSPSLPSPVLPQGGTMIVPAMRVAQQAQPSATMFFGAATAERSAKLVLVRGQSQFGTQWRLQAGETVVGRSDGMVLFPDDDAIAPRHCRLVFRGAELWLEPEDTTNGVFVRLREPTPVNAGDEIVVGSQRLRVLAPEDRPRGVEPRDDVRLLGSMVKAAPPIALLRIASEPALNEVYFRAQRLLTIGRNNCDLNFPRDSFVSERHAQLTMDGALILEDLRSRNGTYLRARASMKLAHGDLVLLGDKVLRVELPR